MDDDKAVPMQFRSVTDESMDSYPLSYTVWAAIDLIMHPLDAGEEADAMVALMACDLEKHEGP